MPSHRLGGEVTIGSTVLGTLMMSTAGGGPMPEPAPDAPIELVLYEDTQAEMVEPIPGLAERRGDAILLLAGFGDPLDPKAEGVRWVRRVVSVDGDTVSFEGACGETLDNNFAALAEHLGRPEVVCAGATTSRTAPGPNGSWERVALPTRR